MNGPASVSSVLWWAIVAVAAVVIVWLARRRMARSRERRDAERLSMRADASHEGARTRHDGGP